MSDVHTIHFSCTFCGHTWTEERAIRRTAWSLPWCRICGVTDPKRGQRVCYGAAERMPAGAMYADQHIKRGATYTIENVKQWQHGTMISLQETGRCSYELLLFTPVDFQRPEQTA